MNRKRRNWKCVLLLIGVVEMGFLSNAGDDAKMATEEYRETLAEGMYRGIRDWLLTK